MSVTCRVKKKIDETHRLMMCCTCGAEHMVEVTIDTNGGWSSPRGGRDCTNPCCPSHQVKAAAKVAAAKAAALPANVAARAAKLQAKAIANTPEDYDPPAVF